MEVKVDKSNKVITVDKDYSLNLLNRELKIQGVEAIKLPTSDTGFELKPEWKIKIKGVK